MTSHQLKRIIRAFEEQLGEGEAYEIVVQLVSGRQFVGSFTLEPEGLLKIVQTSTTTWINHEMIVAVSLGEPL